MCNVYAYAAMVALQTYGAYQGAQGEADKYEAEANTYEYQAAEYDEKERLAKIEANLSEIQSMDTLKIGKVQERKLRIQGNQIKASQNVGYAASGIRVDTGIAADVKAETERLAEGDAITLRKNYAKEAYGYQLNAWKKRGEARTFQLSAVNARKSARNSLESSNKIRNQGFLGALATGLQGASNYKG
jgi:hypothetical protein